MLFGFNLWREKVISQLFIHVTFIDSNSNKFNRFSTSSIFKVTRVFFYSWNLRFLVNTYPAFVNAFVSISTYTDFSVCFFWAICFIDLFPWSEFLFYNLQEDQSFDNLGPRIHQLCFFQRMGLCFFCVLRPCVNVIEGPQEVEPVQVINTSSFQISGGKYFVHNSCLLSSECPLCLFNDHWSQLSSNLRQQNQQGLAPTRFSEISACRIRPS